MLSGIRRHLGDWFVRLLFIVLAVAFAAWGVGGMTHLGSDKAVAHVAGHRIGPEAVAHEYQNEMNRLSQELPNGQQPSAAMRKLVAMQSLERLITQVALQVEINKRGLIVPDAAVRQAVFSMPAFQGSNGAFDKAKFQQLLAANNLTEGDFINLMRQDLAQSELLEPIGAGALAPKALTSTLFAYQYEKRTAIAVMLPFASAPQPATPDSAVLKRWWANNPKTFSTPEYRKIRVVVLSPDVLARHLTVPEAALKTAYAEQKATYQKPEKRSAEILLAPDEAKATALAAEWRTGANWAQMQQAAKTDGATAVALSDALPPEFPDAALAKAVFAAAPGTVTGPIETPLGWHVIEVTGITPGANTSFADARPALEKTAARAEAVNLVYTRVTQFQDAVAADPTLDKMPSDIGLAGVTGTLDANGMTPEGTRAPLPGSPALQKAIITASFQTAKNNLANVVQGPGQSYYALTVNDITPPHVQPFAQVKPQVTAAWAAHQRRHEQNAMATRLMVAVNHGTPLTDAAAKAGLKAVPLPPTGRSEPAAGVPAELLGPLFSLKLHKATMVETKDGFVTAELMAVEVPSEAANPTGYDALQTELTRRTGSDLQQTFVTALREQAHPKVNMPALEQIASQ